MPGAEWFSEAEGILAERLALAADDLTAETARRNQIAATAIIQAALWKETSHPAMEELAHLRHPVQDPLAARRQRLVFASMRSPCTETPTPLQLLDMLCQEDGGISYDLTVPVPK